MPDTKRGTNTPVQMLKSFLIAKDQEIDTLKEAHSAEMDQLRRTHAEELEKLCAQNFQVRKN